VHPNVRLINCTLYEAKKVSFDFAQSSNSYFILLFFPFLLLATYFGLIISKLYIPAGVDLKVQIILVILNIVIAAIVSLSGRIGEYTIRKAGKAFEQEMGRQPNNSLERDAR